MTPPGAPFTVSPSTYTGLVLPGGENDGLETAVFEGLTESAGLRIDGDPADSGYSAWWEWGFVQPLPAGAFLAFDMQWTSDANFLIAQLLGDGTLVPDSQYTMGPRSAWGGSWHSVDLAGIPLPAGISTLRYELSASNSTFTYGLSAIFQRMEVYMLGDGGAVGGEAYDPGDVVRHNGATWLAVEMAFPGDEPGASPAWVQVAKDGLSYQGDWA